MLKSKIEIMSCEAVERLIAGGLPEHTAVVSFFDPPSNRHGCNCTPVDFGSTNAPVFQVAVHDIDIDILPDYGLTPDTYFPEAVDLAGFIIQRVAEGYDIICQCEYGQSRSAACAAAVREFYDRSGIEIFADYRYYPNQLIFNKVLGALREASSCA